MKSLISIIALFGTMSIGLGDDPPVISNQAKSPTVPTAAQNFTVTADLTDDVSLSVTELRYAINGGSESSVSMSNTSGDEYSGSIPSSAYTDGDRVTFYVYAEDGAAQSTTSPTWGFFAGTTDISSFIEVDANRAPLYEYNYARVTGVANVSSSVFGTTGFSFFIQDATGGVKVQKGAPVITATIGNIYTVVGRMRNSNGQFWVECDDPATEITDNGAGTLPSLQILTIAQILADPEAYQSELIGIQHLDKSSGSWPTSGNMATITMTDDGGSNTLLLYIDEDTNIDDNTEPSWPRDVQGILTQYDSSSPYTDVYEIMPRYYSDIQTEGSLPVELCGFNISDERSNSIVIEWTTESEFENLGFIVLRRSIGIEESEWSEIASYLTNDELIGQGSVSHRTLYVYVDEAVEIGGTYEYQLADVSYAGVVEYHQFTVVGAALGASIPNEYVLRPNFPNPFNPTTTISYLLPGHSAVKLSVFDIRGHEVATLHEAEKPPGNYQVQWNGMDQIGNQVSTGVYFCRLEAGSFSQTIKMVYLR